MFRPYFAHIFKVIDMNETQEKLASYGVSSLMTAEAEAKGFSIDDLLVVVSLVEKYGPVVKDLINDVLSVFKKK